MRNLLTYDHVTGQDGHEERRGDEDYFRNEDQDVGGWIFTWRVNSVGSEPGLLVVPSSSGLRVVVDWGLPDNEIWS